MYKLIIVIFMFSSLHIFSQSASFKVIEVKGTVDIKDRLGEWKAPVEGDFLLNGTEIFTGLHSHISLEIGSESYITVNQLSNIMLDAMRVQKELISSEIYLVNGFVIVNAKDTDSYKNKVTVSFMDGRAVFKKAGGEIYLRKEYGAIITAGSGSISITSQLVNAYTIRKSERCAILPGGKQLTNEYFLMHNITSPAIGANSEMEGDLYMSRFHNFYTDSINSNDYGTR